MRALSVMTLTYALLAPAGSPGDEAAPPAGADRGPASNLAGQRQTAGELGEPIVVPTALAIIRSVAFSPNGKVVAVGGGAYVGLGSQAYGGGMALLLDVSSGREIARLKPSDEAIDKKHATEWGDEAKRLLGVKSSEAINKKRDGVAQPDPDPVWSVAFAPDGKTVATATEWGVQLWNAPAGTERVVLYEYGPGQRGVHMLPLYPCVAFSPDGRLLAASNLELWDVPERRLRTKLQATSRGAVVFSPDGRFVASAEDFCRVHLWDVKSGRQLAEDDAQVRIRRAVAVSPDGKTLAAAGEGGAQLWDVRSGAEGLTLKVRPGRLAHGIFGSIDSLAFSPDGKLLATVGADLLKLWYVATVGEMATLNRGELATLDRSARSVAFSPDGKTVAVGGWRFSDGYVGGSHRGPRQEPESVRLYDLAAAIRPEVLAAKARKAAADLVRESKNRTSRQRLNALWSLGPHAEAATPVLVEALGNPSVDVRVQVAVALGLIGSPSAKAALMKLLRNESSEVRGTAVQALAICGQRSGDAVPLLLEALKIAPPDTQKHIGFALQSFVRRDDQETINRMREAFRRAQARSNVESPQPSGVVRRGGQALHDGRPVEEWIERLGRHYEPNEIFGRSDRRGPAAAIRAFGAAEAVPAMIKALQDKRWAMRVGAADGLGMFAADAKAAIPALIQALSDDAGQVREMAADSLAAIHRAITAAPSPELLRLFDHQDASVRVSAARVIAHIDPAHERALTALKAPLQDVVKAGLIPFGTPSYELAQTAMRALQSLGPKAAPAVPELVAILRTQDHPNTNADDYLRRTAAETLGRIGPAAIPALVEGLADPALEVHAAAARTLPQISPDAVPAELVKELGKDAATPRALGWAFQGFGEKGIQALTAALRHPNRDVRLRTIGILRSLAPKPKTAIPALKRASRENEEPLVRQEAIEALRDIEQSSGGQRPLPKGKDEPVPTRP